MATIATIAANTEQQGDMGRRRLLNTQNSPPWSPTDDVLLRELKDVRHLGWREIATYFPGRTSFGCQFRWRRLAAGLTRDNSARASLRSSLPQLNTSLRSPNQGPRTANAVYEHQHSPTTPATAGPSSATTTTTTESSLYSPGASRRLSVDSEYASSGILPVWGVSSAGDTVVLGNVRGGVERRGTF
ncbi:MAG: hypothetical protein M1840_003327 [Geoglossum simile]|nr:MAG: hypothetical protein M1840_003327 [Geoglossum simile]